MKASGTSDALLQQRDKSQGSSGQREDGWRRHEPVTGQSLDTWSQEATNEIIAGV